MKTLSNIFKRVPKKVLMLALIIAVAASMVAVAGTFAVFETTVIGLGETPISDWNFDVRINNDNPVDSVVSGVKLSGDDETQIIDSVTYNLHKTRDDSTEIADYLIAPGTSGYMPIEVDGSDSSVAMVITVKAEFSYTNGFSFTDNLRRTLAITTESESYSYEDEESNAVNATYVGYITYSYYVSYEQVSHWADDDYIDIGFRWDWSEDDDTAYDDIPEYVYTRISVTGKQITNANQIKSADTIINFLYDSADIKSQLQFGSNVLNILNTNVTTGLELEDADIEGDLYLDINANGFTEASATSKLYGTLLQDTLSITTTQDVKFVLGTNRTQHGYLSEYIASSDYLANIPYVSIEAPNADAYISNDFIANKVQTANTLIDILNASMERMGESQADTMYDALTFVINDATAAEALEDYNDGNEVGTVAVLETIISATYANCDVVWDSVSNRFAYISSDGTTVVQKDDISTIDLSKKYLLFKTYSAMPATQTYSIYAAGTWATTSVDDLTVGFDVGGNTSVITAVDYDRSSATTAQSVIIRTNSASTSLTINAPLDTYTHYGLAGSVDIIAIASTSYHECGEVPFVEIAKGRIVLETESKVEQIHVSTKISGISAGGEKTKVANTFDTVIVNVEAAEEIPTFSRDQIALDSIGASGTLVLEIEKTESTSDFVYMFQQGLMEQIKITTGTSTSAGATEAKAIDSNAIAATDASSETNTIAKDIANNLAAGKTEIAAEDLNSDGSIKADKIAEYVSESGLTEEEKEDVLEEKQNEAIEEETFKDFKDHYYWKGNRATSFEGDHKGTAEDPYQIKTAQQLALLAYNVNYAVELKLGKGTAEGYVEYNKANYLLIADIDISLLTWDPIGNLAHPFEGSISGKYDTDKSHKIIGLNDANFARDDNEAVRTTYTDSEGTIYGLFGVVGAASGEGTAQTFEYIELVDVNINSTEAVICAAFIAADTMAAKKAGTNSTINSSLAADITVDHISVSGAITVTLDQSNTQYKTTIGGVVGKFYTNGNKTITNCSCSATLTTKQNLSDKCGGIMGYCKSGTCAINNNTFSGTIDVGGWQVGGIVVGETSTGTANYNSFTGCIKTTVVDTANTPMKDGGVATIAYQMIPYHTGNKSTGTVYNGEVQIATTKMFTTGNGSEGVND